jgi:hypothetical protein
MRKHIPILLCIALCLLTMIPKVERRAPRPGPVATALATATFKDKDDLRRYFNSMADVTARDKGQRVKTLAQWREAHRNALGLAFGGTGLVGKYPGLDVAIDGILHKQQGLVDQSLATPLSDGRTLSDVLVDACKEVEAQCE